MSTATLVSRSLRSVRAFAVLPVFFATSVQAAAPARVGPDSVAAQSSARKQPGLFAVKQDARMRHYMSDMFGLGSIASVGAGSALDQMRNDPPEWTKSSSGFGKRVASNAGSRAAAVTTRHVLAAALDRSTVYARCRCTDGGGRIGHGIVAAFTDLDSHDRRVFSEPILAGNAAGAFAPLIWRPSYSAGTAVGNMALAYGLSAAGNVLREFISWWP